VHAVLYTTVIFIPFRRHILSLCYWTWKTIDGAWSVERIVFFPELGCISSNIDIVCEYYLWKKPDIIRTFVVLVLVLVHELYLSTNFKYLFYCTCNQVVVAKRILVDQINPMIYMFFWLFELLSYILYGHFWPSLIQTAWLNRIVLDTCSYVWAVLKYLRPSTRTYTCSSST